MQLDSSQVNWLSREDVLHSLASAIVPMSERDRSRLLATWRRKYTAEQAAILMEQVRLRERSVGKVWIGSQMLWTEPLLEQASDSWSARMIAELYPAGVPVWDLCCGAGVDGWAMVEAGRSLAGGIDIDPATCLLARCNWSLHTQVKETGKSLPPVHCQEAELWEGSPDSWLHVDPDRRKDGVRTTWLSRYSPGVETLVGFCKRYRGGSIKLAPGSELPGELSGFGGRHWISVGRSVRQQRLWWGNATFPSETRSVHRIAQTVPWDAGQIAFLQVRESDRLDSIDCIVEEEVMGSFIGDCDPVIRAAGLTTAVAKQSNARVLGDEHGYLVSDNPVSNPWIDWFRLDSWLPLDGKVLRKELRTRGIGLLECKKRGVDVDLESLRKSLKLDGDRPATLLITRIGKRIKAALAFREAV